MKTLLLINDLLQTAHTHWGSPKLIDLHEWTMLRTLHRIPINCCMQAIHPRESLTLHLRLHIHDVEDYLTLVRSSSFLSS